MSSTSKKSQTLARSNNPYENCEENCNYVPYIPTHIVIEILSRVRIKTLFNCRLVCKSWAAIISTADFAQLHLSRSPTTCLIKPLYKKRRSKTLHLIDPECTHSKSEKLVFVPNINLPTGLLGFINSCNGLVCFGQFVDHDYENACNIFVCNPVLREYINVPNFTEFDIAECAFGFSHVTNQYKVVMSLFEGVDDNYETEIYTLGEGSWRNLGSSFYHIGNHHFNAFLNGVLHWLSFGPPCPWICCFDFESEQFCAVPEPCEFDKPDVEYVEKTHVGVINENLSICDFRRYIVIWVMKDYGVKESWSKNYIITDMINQTLLDSYETIVINGNGEIIIKVHNKHFMLYDPELGAFKSSLKIFGVRSEFHAICYVPSLVSLKDVAKGEDLKVLA